MRWWWGMSVISQTKLWWFVPIYQCPVSSTDKFPAGDSGYWERRAFTVGMSCRYWEWLIISVTRRTQRPVWATGCRSHHWPPRTLWSSCSCSSSGATPSSSPTGPGTGSSTRMGTRDQICGGHFQFWLVKKGVKVSCPAIGSLWTWSSRKQRTMNKRRPAPWMCSIKMIILPSLT